MAKKIVKKTTKKRVNRTDITLRNLQAMKKVIFLLLQRLEALERSVGLTKLYMIE